MRKPREKFKTVFTFNFWLMSLSENTHLRASVRSRDRLQRQQDGFEKALAIIAKQMLLSELVIPIVQGSKAKLLSLNTVGLSRRR